MKARLLLLVVLSALTLAVLLPRTRPKPAPIRIGVLHSLTGTLAESEAPLVDAVRLAVDEVNAAGGLLGRPVEMVIADGRSDPAVFAAEAERLIVEDDISALFACWTSACRKAVKPVVEAHEHLLFYPVQYEGMEASAHIVYLGATPNQQIIPGTRWALDTFGERVYLVGSDYLFPRAAHLIIRDLVTAAGGTVVAERLVPLGADTFDAVVEDIRAQEPDVVINTVNGSSNRALFRALRASGIDLGQTPVLSFSIAEEELTAMGPEAFHPAHYAVWGYFQSQPSEANRAFVSAFRARFGEERVTSDPIESAYNAVRLWANAVREAGTEAPVDVNLTIGRQSVPGPSGVVAVDAATRHLWKYVRIGRARTDGQFDEVQASATLIRPAPFPAYRSFDAWRRLAAEAERGVGAPP